MSNPKVELHIKDNLARQWSDIKGFIAGLRGVETKPKVTDKTKADQKAKP